jgi:hypothetical protein
MNRPLYSDKETNYWRRYTYNIGLIAIKKVAENPKDYEGLFVGDIDGWANLIRMGKAKFLAITDEILGLGPKLDPDPDIVKEDFFINIQNRLDKNLNPAPLSNEEIATKRDYLLALCRFAVEMLAKRPEVYEGVFDENIISLANLVRNDEISIKDISHNMVGLP